MMDSIMSWNWNTIILAIIAILFSLIISSCAGKAPTTIGQFSVCPGTPNCVSTKNINTKNYISPIYYKGSRDNAKRILLLAIQPIKSVSIKKELDQFIHIEVTSKFFHFVDDVEFYLNEPGVIHFRSASRIGYSDLGVNRERMETIRKTFQKLQE
jgi:uncharacterized protein (DUF1499 family)